MNAPNNLASKALTAAVLTPASGGKPKQLIVLLHGYGANGDDLLGLAPLLAEGLPDACFIAPDAPDACEMAPSGYQWFGLQDWSTLAMLSGAERAAPILNAFLDKQLEKFQLSDENLALIGFSQGAMMAVYVSLRRPECCAGVVSFSGMLLGGETLPAELRSRPPVCLIHGDADEVVPYSALESATEGLEAADIFVEAHTCHELGHGINEKGIDVAISFLRKSLAIS